jgi:hypothetical protein
VSNRSLEGASSCAFWDAIPHPVVKAIVAFQLLNGSRSVVALIGRAGLSERA